jgi:5-methylcytosine-specific restriction endonuclease McrA
METTELRLCLRPPIPEIEDAARMLDAAVSAHSEGKRDVAEELLRLANNKNVWEWTDSIWGKMSPYVQYRPIPNAPPTLLKEQRVKERKPASDVKRLIHIRDGYYCRFCCIPVIRSEIRENFCDTYPEAVPWGCTNVSQHAAFQAMSAQYDHVLPHARGGNNDIDNIILTCAPCNYGRMSYTLEEVGLLDPRDREPRRGTWEGLERFRP